MSAGRGILEELSEGESVIHSGRVPKGRGPRSSSRDQPSISMRRSERAGGSIAIGLTVAGSGSSLRISPRSCASVALSEQESGSRRGSGWFAVGGDDRGVDSEGGRFRMPGRSARGNTRTGEPHAVAAPPGRATRRTVRKGSDGGPDTAGVREIVAHREHVDPLALGVELEREADLAAP